MIIVGLIILLVAAGIGGALFFRNNREKAEKVVDKAEKIRDIIKE